MALDTSKYQALYRAIQPQRFPSIATDDAPTATEDFADAALPTAADTNEIRQLLHDCKVLVVGAGGLGCELLKDLALSGFRDLHVIDMDTIDVSNLNRQFLFRLSDVGKPKAVVAAVYIESRVQGVKVTPHHAKIQDMGDDFYAQFQLVVCGLDSVEARRWMNAYLVGQADLTNPDTIKPMIDGGTEGFNGQARVIIPKITSCYECSLDLFKKQTVYPICTIANTPRVPEHCIEWASVIAWPEHFPDQPLDTDNPEHLRWLYNSANGRAAQFGIRGVTYTLTQGVVKNIIPAIASTNAVIAAACANEALKLVTSCHPHLDNYMMYTGTDGVYTYTYCYARRADCPVCGQESKHLTVAPQLTLAELLDLLAESPDIQLASPSLRSAHTNRSLYLQAPPQLEQRTRPNLSRPLRELMESGEEIIVTDKRLPIYLSLIVSFSP
ncbi:NEDD8 activating enzyme [Dimargaris xerosporica]|nr:NEDD8 activating enzyme [Dimargaris xerosporica]